MISLLLFLLTCSAGMDRDVKFDFQLSSEHRGAIAIYGSITSDLPREGVDVIWQQTAGPRIPQPILTDVKAIRPFVMVGASGVYTFQFLVGSRKKELCTDQVTFTVTSKESK